SPWGGGTPEAGWLRRGVKAFPLVPAQTSREPYGEGDGKIVRTHAVQPPKCPWSSLAGRLPEVLGVHQPDLGREVSRSMVYPHHAEQDRADEEDRQNLARAPGLNSQLVPCQRDGFGRLG